MKKMKTTGIVILALTIVMASGIFPADAQQAPAPNTPPAAAEKPEKIVVKGKILTMKSVGYYVKGEEPSSNFIIVNQNPGRLKWLMHKNRKVTVEGRLTAGADRLFIEKIDGKTYYGGKNNGAQ